MNVGILLFPLSHFIKQFYSNSSNEFINWDHFRMLYLLRRAGTMWPEFGKKNPKGFCRRQIPLFLTSGFGWKLGLALAWLCMMFPGTMTSVIVCGGCYWPRIFLLSVRIQLPFPPNSKLILLIPMTKYSIYPQGFYTKFPLWVDLSVDYSVTVSASDCFYYCSFLISSSLWKLSKILMVFVSMDVLESTCQFLPKFCCDSGWDIISVMSLGYGGNGFFRYVRMPQPGKW